MNKPHVDKLYYQMIIKEGANYDKAPPVETENNTFSMTASKDGVVFTMKKHCETEQKAKILTDKYLDDWTILIGLMRVPGEITFLYDRADIIDLEPPTGLVINCNSGRLSVLGCDAMLTVHRTTIPEPNVNFAVSPDVESMYNRYKTYQEQEGPGRLLSMAYWILTTLEVNAGGRARAANKFGISKKVLDRLGALCSQGNSQDARKAPKNGAFIPLEGPAKVWIEKAVKRIIERSGLVEGGTKNLPQITMHNL